MLKHPRASDQRRREPAEVIEVTLTVYPDIEVQPAAIPTPAAPALLHVFKIGRKLVNWRARSFHGPDHVGSVSRSGFGDPLVFASSAAADVFRKKHSRALIGAELVPMTDMELLRLGEHTVSAAGLKFVPTSRAAAFLALTPEQQAGPEGREVLR